MITQEKLEVYKYFGGDIDGWSRIGTSLQKQTIKDEDWIVIDGFIQDLFLVKSGIASISFINSLEKKLHEFCDSEKTIQELKNMVDLGL